MLSNRESHSSDKVVSKSIEPLYKSLTFSPKVEKSLWKHLFDKLFRGKI